MKTDKRAKWMLSLSMIIFGTLGPFTRNISVTSGELALYRAMLEVKGLQVYYGVIQALKDVSFEVNQGEVIALIGANGAGKTTTLHTLTGLLPAKQGSIIFEGVDITKTPAHKIVEMGIAHVPEGRRVFSQLSVYENLLVLPFFARIKSNKYSKSIDL